MADLTLREWAEREEVPYPTAYGWFRDGKLTGAHKVGSRIHVPAETRTEVIEAHGNHPDRRYRVMMCANCHHPASLHVIDQWEPRATHCRCCEGCPGYADGEYGSWSDAKTDEVHAHEEERDA